MKTEVFHLELITPCFCGGAEPEKQAEIRAPSIRGQLRWWFRTLGGFQSLATHGMDVREQENLIFGTVAGGEGRAGSLLLQVTPPSSMSSQRSGADLGADAIASPAGYFLFPLRSQKDKQTGSRIPQYRGVFLDPLPSFEMRLRWRGDIRPWPDANTLQTDTIALGAVFGHLGALGFRSRRGFGALRLMESNATHGEAVTLARTLARFADKHSILVKTLGAFQARPALQEAYWKWVTLMRTHGSTFRGSLNSGSPNWAMIRDDHDRGIDVGSRRGTSTDKVCRAALGLPIIQQFSQPSRPEVDWYPEFDAAKIRSKRDYRGEGRFASPILLRPHRDAQGKWHALVIFVDAHKWPNDPATGQPKQVFLNGQPRAVSLDLYNKMKEDPALKAFP
jgi:CRISPR/Cas system CMR-associated protein Cmr1 (group 7 of RAMP superfamily)